jgi:hypothetical protein
MYDTKSYKNILSKKYVSKVAEISLKRQNYAYFYGKNA